jgi:hypothetical protein
MLAMKPFLALTPLLAAVAAFGQSTVPVAQQVSDARAAATVTSSGKPAHRQLSAEQRAELRRQLYEFNRLRGKGY